MAIKTLLFNHLAGEERAVALLQLCSYCCVVIWIKSGKFGQSAKFGQQPFLFHILIIGIKNKLTRQRV